MRCALPVHALNALQSLLARSVFSLLPAPCPMAERAPCSACPQAASSGDMSRLEQLLSEDAGVVMKAAQSGEPGVRFPSPALVAPSFAFAPPSLTA